mmetsp:Transcript_108831/g.330950  ORF Transcript_108831/g.330950 Transcript_108831/m.330950 type:complete len:414 (-) Transcript_108831:115-1356(-)
MQLLELADDRLAVVHDRQRNVFQEFSVAGETRHAVNVAARHGHLGLLRLLLERSACVGQKSEHHESALQVAVQNGHAEVVAFLLQHGAWDVEERRWEVLELAAEREMASVFESVRTSSSGVQAGTGSGSLSRAAHDSAEVPDAGCTELRACTPVSRLPTPHIAARREAWSREGPPSAVWHGGLRRICDDATAGTYSWGWSPLQSLPLTPASAAAGGAAAVPWPACVGSLHELSSGSARLRGELHRAIRKGDMDRLRATLARGAPLDAAVDLGYGERGTCVDWACVCGHPVVAMELLGLADAHGIGDALAVRSTAALLWAATMGNLELLRELLRRGADVGTRCPGPGQRSLLTQAVYSMRPEEALELLRSGAWEEEGKAQREHLLSWVQNRPSMAAAFREVGIGSQRSPLPAIR